jgi:hypothetical protein
MYQPTIALIAATLTAVAPLEPSGNPQELGRVQWGRDLEAALAESASSGRPVLLLFQEIPGCQTCVDFGTAPMSHPLLVEVIETEFVPVAIYNNKAGRDEEILKRYEEPAWNFPVMRFVDGDGRDIVTRQDRIWTTGAVAKRLLYALHVAGRTAPAYLELAAAETTPDKTEKATFAMHCYWEGEGALGALPGVLSTRAGWVAGDEVVEVVFDPSAIGYETLVGRARERQCASKVYAHDDGQLEIARRVVGDGARRLDEPARTAKPSDQKYALTGSELRYLPLTPMQAMKVNADLRRDKDPKRWLSPRQQEMLSAIRTALAADTEALAGLERPDSIEGLATYQVTLQARLDGR